MAHDSMSYHDLITGQHQPNTSPYNLSHTASSHTTQPASHSHSQVPHQGTSPSNMMYSFLPPGTPASISMATSTAPTPSSPPRIATPAFNMGMDMGMGMDTLTMVSTAPPPASGTGLQRSSRPCDTCRVRKTRCVRQDNALQCILCAFHGKQCTYLRGPPPRGSTAANRHKDKERTRAANSARRSVSSGSPGNTTVETRVERDGNVGVGEGVKGETGQGQSQGGTPTGAVAGLTITRGSTGSSVIDTTELQPANSENGDNGVSRNIQKDLPQSPVHNHAHNHLSPINNTPSNGPSPRSPLSPSPELLPLLSGTLGLSLATHPEYIGPTSHREPALLDLQRYEAPTRAGSTAGSEHSSTYGHPNHVNPIARRIDERTMFLIYPDEATASEEKRIADCDAVEACVRPMGKALVDLYFRIVHPSYPVLHKEVFVSKHANSHRCFAPPLLAAVYLIALDYQLYDPNMASGTMQLENANGPRELEALAERTLQADLKRPKISTLQAGLLLLQRHRPNGASSDWMFTAQMVALAQGLGLHVDCSAWEIPEWEKGLRRRLGWALYVQDRWGVFSHGRLRLLSDEDWDLQPCSTADFPESSADDEDPTADGNIGVDAGRDLFIRQVELARILTEVMTLFYTSAATKPGGTLDRMGVMAAVDMARPVMARLREWRHTLPATLQLDCIEHRKLSANGSLHLALAATEAALHRALVRLLTPSSPPELVNAVRAAATNRVVGAINLLKALRPEHMGAFWSGQAAHQVAMIGSLAGLLWVTSVSREEMQWREGMMTELRWVLRVRGQSSGFIREALRLLENDLGRVGINATQGLLGERTPVR